MFKSRTLLYIILFIVALALIKIFFLNKDVSENSPASQAKKSAGMKVDGVVLKDVSLDEKIFSSGTVMANEEVELRTEVGGKITQLNFKEGTKVNKGDLLVKINDSDLQAQLSKLKSNRKISVEKSDRQKQLLDINGISREEYDDVMNGLATIDADIKYTEAQIAKTEIRAPFTGQIGLRNISEGSFVNQNFLIATMQQIDPVKIDFSIPEKYSSYISSGKEITFTIEGASEVFTGKIFAIEPKIDQATRSLKIRALTENHSGKIVPGSFAKVNVILSRSDSAITVPTQAIIPVLKGKKVLVCRNGMAISQTVTTGIRSENNIEVLSGLAAGDTIITTGIMQLKDSMNVNVIISKK